MGSKPDPHPPLFSPSAMGTPLSVPTLSGDPFSPSSLRLPISTNGRPSSWVLRIASSPSGSFPFEPDPKGCAAAAHLGVENEQIRRTTGDAGRPQHGHFAGAGTEAGAWEEAGRHEGDVAERKGKGNRGGNTWETTDAVVVGKEGKPRRGNVAVATPGHKREGNGRERRASPRNVEGMKILVEGGMSRRAGPSTAVGNQATRGARVCE
eukprot:scaffold625_cov324-Pavlova_lutheri.AAC.46